jgi:hypothetical protein
MRRSSACSALQYVRGFSPGTAAPSPRAFWPLKSDKPSDATSVLKSKETRLRERFIVICIWWLVMKLFVDRESPKQRNGLESLENGE